jgi:hypothetical protein
MKVERGVRQGFKPMVKSKETGLGGIVGEFVVPKRRTYEDRSMKRHDVMSRLSSEYTNCSGSRAREDEV